MNKNSTYQQREMVSIKRTKLIDLAENTDYNKRDYRVLLALFSQLDGYTPPKNGRTDYPDPLNFKIIDIESMSNLLSMSKKEVKKSVKKFYEDGIIERGSNDTISNGYRFTF